MFRWAHIKQTAFLGEVLISWLLLLVSLPLCACVIWTIRETNYEIDGTTRVEDIPVEKTAVVAVVAISEDRLSAHANTSEQKKISREAECSVV